MRASLITLVALVASPLMVFAAPSPLGSLIDNGVSSVVPLGDGLSDEIDTVKLQQLFELIQGLTHDEANDLVDNLTDSQILDLIYGLEEDQFEDLLRKVGDNNRIQDILEKVD